MNVVTFASQPHLYGTPWTGPWVADCPPSELQGCYAGWEHEMTQLLEVSLFVCIG